ncbi:MAG: hypothetical protein GXO30_08750, partial [Epsilonproteobacteria bacterium]|nr:hypothetical protein [Campylobacterota bacterium]
MVILRYILVVTLVFSSFLFASNLETGSTVVPNDKEYFKYKDEKSNIELLYSKENLKFAKETLKTDVVVVKEYQKLFDWKLDETLYVGLISSNNQIANGFSTQWPNNRQVNYMGGTQMVDYFTSTSWLKTLLYHEAAHNYQVNAKKSGITQVLHSVFGNGSFIVPFIPITLPNSFENSFMLEGNAVLNESWHGNGGRLYSGRFFVQTLLQAKANKIIPQDVYNKKMAFPYGETHYITGGFYNLYMAKRYGLKKINSYFLNHSQYWYWPFITDESMRESVGVSFEDSLEEFSKSYADIAKNVVLADGKKLITSQFFYPLNSDKNEIFFMVNTTGVQAPKLIRIDKKSLKIKKYKDSWLSGKVIKNNGKYYTQNSRYISTTKIYQGLFDSDGFIKKSTASKMIQGYLSDFTEVYFDVASSYSQPQLYVGKNFYGQVNSSVFIDEDDNLYYFKQDAKHRTLYKNKKPLFTYEGFYGIVSDVDSCGSVYFIANSKYGSTLYKYINGSVFRVLKADNVIDAKLIDKQNTPL